MEEFEILSTHSELLGFEETSIYRDFINELDVRIEGLTELLHDPDLQFTGRHYDVFRGGIKNMKEMKGIFQDLAAGKESQSNAISDET